MAKKRDKPIKHKFPKPMLENEHFKVGEEVEIKGETFIVKKLNRTTTTIRLKK